MVNMDINRERVEIFVHLSKDPDFKINGSRRLILLIDVIRKEYKEMEGDFIKAMFIVI